MDIAHIYAKLIREYNAQHNARRRAQAGISKMLFNGKTKESTEWAKGMRDAGYGLNYLINDKDCFSYSRDTSERAYTSKRLKDKEIKRYEGEILSLEIHPGGGFHGVNPSYGANNWRQYCEEQLAECKLKPVSPLGKLYRKWVTLVIKEKRAYNRRYEIRCAIKVLNELSLGIKVKFGKGISKSFSLIEFVEIDGFDIPVSRFLENIQFEEAILNG